MASVAPLDPPRWTLADLLAEFGPLDAGRVRTNPAPGTATEGDVVRIHASERRLCELVQGVLVEKSVGFYESFLAIQIATLLRAFVDRERLGIVTGADGILRLAPGLIRIPDVAFISWSRLPGGKIPRTPIAGLVPDLAVEVLSPSNTRQEMARKLADYFTAGVRLTWYVDPAACSVSVYTSPETCQVQTGADTLDGSDVLPGLQITLQELFAEPSPQ